MIQQVSVKFTVNANFKIPLWFPHCGKLDIYLKGVLITMGIPISFGTFLLCFSVQILGVEIPDGLRISEIIALFYFC